LNTAVIPAKAGIHFTPFAFRQGSYASAGKGKPPFIHPHPQMDSGFRRNDEQNQIRRGSREVGSDRRGKDSRQP